MAVDRRTGAVVVVLLLAAGGLGVAAGAVFGGTTGNTPGRPAGVARTEPAPATTTTPGLSPGRTAEKIPAPLPTGPAVAVYVLGDTDTGARLYRELRPGGGAGSADPVWLLAPADGGSARSVLTVTGTASVFEATVSVEVRRGTALMARTIATASVGAPRRGDWKATMTVLPGDYVVSAYEASAKDGARIGVDTKRVTVTGP